MTRETLEELRERLLGQHNVQQMIQVRAYEIYQMRGGRPGGEAQDWFHAEGEVLAFLIARESAQEDEPTPAEAAPAAPALESPPLKKTRTRAAKPSEPKQSGKKATTTKRATPKKSDASKAKPKRPVGQSKSEESGT